MLLFSMSLLTPTLAATPSNVDSRLSRQTFLFVILFIEELSCDSDGFEDHLINTISLLSFFNTLSKEGGKKRVRI